MLDLRASRVTPPGRFDWSCVTLTDAELELIAELEADPDYVARQDVAEAELAAALSESRRWQMISSVAPKACPHVRRPTGARRAPRARRAVSRRRARSLDREPDLDPPRRFASRYEYELRALGLAFDVLDSYGEAGVELAAHYLCTGVGKVLGPREDDS